MNVVVDTNIFISSFYGGSPKKNVDLWKTGRITLCLSPSIVEEYIEVFTRIGLEKEKEFQEIITLLGQGSDVRFSKDTPTLKLVKDDPDDDKFIECAVALQAEYVISGDQALLAVERYMNIKIVSPREFLELIKQN